MSTTEESGLVQAYLLDGTGGARRVEWEGVKAWIPSDGVLWVNLDYTAADAIAWLEDGARIDPLVREALLDADPRPRATVHDDALMLIVRGINMNEGSAPEDMISVRSLIEPRRIITMRRRASRSLKALSSDIERGQGATSGGDLTALLVDRIVDHVVIRVDALGDQIAACEDQALAETRGELRAQLADQRRRAIALRRFLAPQREALAKLAQIHLPWLDDTHRARIAEAADRMTRTVEELDAARDRAAVTQEELASRLAEMTNARLYTLSIVTAIFLPLGFVCALLGVNVGGIPLRDAEWAFWALCAVFGAFTVGMLWFFKRRGWF
jgi:zinc transporter